MVDLIMAAVGSKIEEIMKALVIKDTKIQVDQDGEDGLVAIIVTIGEDTR